MRRFRHSVTILLFGDTFGDTIFGIINVFGDKNVDLPRSIVYENENSEG